jgi:lysozyme
MAMNYVLSPQGVTFITTEESFEPKAYDKDGHWTIGFGHTGIMISGEPVGPDSNISKDDSITLFRKDIHHTLDSLWKAAPGIFNQPQVDALVSLLFNCGVGILELEHTLGQALTKRDIEGVANSILLYDMATINGVHGPFLASRRKAEYEMFNGAKTVTTPSGTFECAAP